MFPPRPFQQRAFDATIAHIKRGKRRVCIVAPTGGGKTYLGSMFVNVASRPVLWIAHRKELIHQAARAIESAIERPVNIVLADESIDRGSNVTVASTQTLLARGLRPECGLLIGDEFHHYSAAAESWGGLAAHYRDSVIIGLTATPERSDGGPLDDICDVLVVAASYSELRIGGHLCDCDVITSREFSNKLECTPWEAYARHGRGERAVIFCASVAEAIECASHIPGCAAIHERLSPAERSAALGAHVIANVGILTEGWDSPETSVGILARTCGHASIYLQIAGRILRADKTNPNKRATLIDLCGNFHVHGHPLEDREYSLSGEAIRRKPCVKSVWQCVNCGWADYGPPANRICPRCDERLPEPKRLKVRENGRLQKVSWKCKCGFEHSHHPLYCPACGAETPRHARVSKDNEEERRRYYDNMLAKQHASGYKNGWAAFRYFGKYGQRPPRSWG